MPEAFLESDPRAQTLKAQIAERLIAIAPRGWHCIFCDHEWRQSASQSTGIEITISVAKKLFGGVECSCLDLAKDGWIYTYSEQLAALAMSARGNRECTLNAIIRRNGHHEWFVDFAPPARITARNADLTAELKDPALRRPFTKFAARDEWLGRIPPSYIPRLVS